MPIFLNLPQGKIYSNHVRHFDIKILSLNIYIIDLQLMQIKSFPASNRNQLISELSAANLFVAWLKVYKYMSFNKTMATLTGTIAQVRFVFCCISVYNICICNYIFYSVYTKTNETFLQSGGDLVGFIVIFMIVFMAYAQLGYLMFGVQVYILSSHTKAYEFHVYIWMIAGHRYI